MPTLYRVRRQTFANAALCPMSLHMRAGISRRATLQAAATLLLPVGSVAGRTSPPAPADVPPSRPGLDRPLFGAVSWTLPNGLRIVLIENRRAPVVAHYLHVAAGSAEDPPGRSGTAHFLEHMLFKGSSAVPSGMFSRIVAREGGQNNAFTGRDLTSYFQVVEASRLPLMMRMEADRFASPLIPAEEVEPERSVVLEERRQVVESQPRTRFQEAFTAAFWGRDHWRGRPILGWEEDIRVISRDDMAAFHYRHYTAGNATVIISGDVAEADVRRWADDFYGAVPPGPASPPMRGRTEIVPVPRKERLVWRDQDAWEAFFVRTVAAPSLTWGDTTMTYPLSVLAHLLGGGPGSRIRTALVDSGLATSAGASYNGHSLGPGTFSLYASPRRGVSQEAIEQALEAEIRRLLDQGARVEEVQRAIRQTTAGALLALDGPGAAPRILGGALVLGKTLEDVEFWPRRLAEVSAADVDRAARAVLGTPGQALVGWLLPEEV